MVLHDAEKCMLCGGCVAVCPKLNVLFLYSTYLDVNQENCIDCGECVKVCPVGAMSPEK